MPCFRFYNLLLSIFKSREDIGKESQNLKFDVKNSLQKSIFQYLMLLDNFDYLYSLSCKACGSGFLKKHILIKRDV